MLDFAGNLSSRERGTHRLLFVFCFVLSQCVLFVQWSGSANGWWPDDWAP